MYTKLLAFEPFVKVVLNRIPLKIFIYWSHGLADGTRITCQLWKTKAMIKQAVVKMNNLLTAITAFPNPLSCFNGNIIYNLVTKLLWEFSVMGTTNLNFQLSQHNHPASHQDNRISYRFISHPPTKRYVDFCLFDKTLFALL